MEPTWALIGAQRSGTTWFSDLLCRHPAVGIVTGGHRFGELHYFDHFLRDKFTAADAEGYRRLFGEGQGERTPYLSWPWVAPLLQAAAPKTLVIVLLRDPVERCLSALRWHSRLESKGYERLVWNALGASAVWGGMYATQLKVWSRYFPAIHVEQYERIVTDPQSGVEKVWTKLGLEPLEIGDVSARSETSTDGVDHWPDLRLPLRSLYGDQVRQLEGEWGIDRRLWRG